MKLLFPIVSILISGTIFFTLVKPLYGEVSQLRTNVAAYNTALENSASLQKTQDALLSQYKNISQDDKDRLSDFLPNTVNNIAFILQVEQIANLYNMPIKSIKFDAPKPTDSTATPGQPADGSVLLGVDPTANLPYGIFSMEFTTEGTYPMFTSFLKDLEHNLRLVDIKSVAFDVPPPPTKGTVGVTQNPNIYTYTLKVDTYWLK
jgi:hypothetical protein